MGAEEAILEEKGMAWVVIELQSVGLVAKVLKPSAMMVPRVVVVKKFPSVVATEDLKLVVTVEVPTVVILVIREAPEVVIEGAQVEKDNEIVVEEVVMMPEVRVEVEVFDMDPKVLQAEKVVQHPIPLETSETKCVVVAVEFPLPLKEGTAVAVVEYLDPLKEAEEAVMVKAAAVVGGHNLVEEEEKPPIELWDDPEEDLWAA